nr:protein stum [Helicoverpa armigera]
MALKLKYKDEHGVVHINMSPTPSSPKTQPDDLTGPKFDTINNRFGQYDLFGGKYDVDSGGETPRSLFRSRYNSIEEELANTPYAFTTERSLRLNSANKLDITINRDDNSPSKDIQDDRFFKRKLSLEYDESLFGPQIDFKVNESGAPAFTVTQLIHAQDRYFDLSGRQSASPGLVADVSVARREDEAFTVLSAEVKCAQEPVAAAKPAVATTKRKKESSFAILAETPVSRPTSPRSLPVDIKTRRVSPFRGRGFREETSRHNTPKTSAANSRANSPPRRRTNSLSRIDNMAQTATLPLPIHNLPRPHSPRNFLKENIEEVREISELNREKHEAEAERKRIEEEEAILKEMGVLDKSKSGSKSLVTSRTNSRSNSPSKINLKSRDSSPSAIIHFENIPANSKEFVNADDGIRKPVTHRSRVRSVSKSQPQSNNGSPKHSKIPKRQSSVSPTRTTTKRESSMSRRPLENNLNRNQRFISSSTSSIHETIRIGSQVHDKRGSKSTQHLSISPAHIRGKPPISPGRGGPPPSNRTINAKRLSPIVGTPNKSPTDDLKPSSARTTPKPTPVPRKTVKTAGNTPATSRLNSRQPSRAVSRDPSPDKRKTKTPVSKPVTTTPPKPVSRAPSTRTTQKPTVTSKPEPKKPISRTNSVKSLTRAPSTKNLAEKPPLKKTNSRKDISDKSNSTNKINEVGRKDSVKEPKKTPKGKDEDKAKAKSTRSTDSMTDDNVVKQDNETQYDKITNEKGELVIMTKKNIISMTTAAITSQPLELVSTVTNQLPAAFEKAREKGIFERLSSKESLVGKEDVPEKPEKPATHDKEPAKEKPHKRTEHKEKEKEVEEKEKEKVEEKRPPRHNKNNHDKPIFTEDQMKLRLLQPPYNNPQVERAKQKIEAILKEPEVSTENILTASAKSRELKKTAEEAVEKTKAEAEKVKEEVTNKVTEVKDQVVKQNEKMTEEIRSEVTKIVDSIITPVEQPKDITEKKDNIKDIVKKVEQAKKDIEPIVTVVNEKKKNGGADIAEKVNETLVKGEGDIEVQSSNLSTPGVDKIKVQKKLGDGNGSDRSAQSNGGFPQSTSTTPKPPARTKKETKETPPEGTTTEASDPTHTSEDKPKDPNFCQRLMKKCKSRCCACCTKGEDSDDEDKDKDKDKERKKDEMQEGKKGMMSKLNCCKKGVDEEKAEQEIRDMERAAGKASIEYENETKPKRTLRDIFCGCCGRRRRVADTGSMPRNVAESMSPAPEEVGCCGRKKRHIERRDSILSDRPPTSCCNNRLCTWLTGMCRRSSEQSSSRRTSMFSKNKSMSPTLPPEDTRKKLDTSLVEHTSVMRGAIPVLPIVLAYFCLLCNIVVPGLGSILSGMFCLCFGIPRFGVHDGAKHRIGSFVINLLVGCGQLFTVLFCLVGWGWSIWWGVIMVKTSRKYRKLKREAAAAEAEAAPPVTSNNHTRA